MAMKSFRVVYAEDDDMVRATVAQMMVEHGLDVHECSDGGEATLLCSVFRPDAVLLDLEMPRMDGCEAARRIREQHPDRNTRIIALTGAGSDAARQAEMAGFDDFLRKPISASKLIGALQRSN